MWQPLCCLTHHPGISSNITNATLFSTPSMPPTLAHRPLNPCSCTNNPTPAGTSLQNAAYPTHASTSPRLARHQRKYKILASTPPMQAQHPLHPRQHKFHAIFQTPGYPIKLLKLLALKFQEEIQQFLLLVFSFTAFTFQAFLSIFIEVQKTAIEKLIFLEETSLPYLKDDYFFKNKCIFFQKKLFPNISVALGILCILSLEKQFSKNQLPSL